MIGGHRTTLVHSRAMAHNSCARPVWYAAVVGIATKTAVVGIATKIRITESVIET